MRGGVEETFDVKYENPPLFCFFCGLIEHGTKDCDDYKDEDEPTLNYGLWLKDSPWKHAIKFEDRWRRITGEGNCKKVNGSHLLERKEMNVMVKKI
ncbi:hypothetical protein RDABS01_025307 [Bienertia sinuspersici]